MICSVKRNRSCGLQHLTAIFHRNTNTAVTSVHNDLDPTTPRRRLTHTSQLSSRSQVSSNANNSSILCQDHNRETSGHSIEKRINSHNENRPRGSLHASHQKATGNAGLATRARLKRSYAIRSLKYMYHWIAIAVASRAGNYQGSKDWTARFVVSIRRNIYTCLRAALGYSCESAKEALSRFSILRFQIWGVVGHMRCALACLFACWVMELTPRFKGEGTLVSFGGDTVFLSWLRMARRRFVIVFFTRFGSKRLLLRFSALR